MRRRRATPNIHTRPVATREMLAGRELIDIQRVEDVGLVAVDFNVPAQPSVSLRVSEMWAFFAGIRFAAWHPR